MDAGCAGLMAGLRAQGISSETVLTAMATVPRPAFVPEALGEQAWEDHPLPIGLGQTISQPFVVAYMTEQLEIRPGDQVLDVGTGCGYQAAILAACGAQVTSIEVLPELSNTAAQNLREVGVDVSLVCGDGAMGVPSAAPFDGIVVAAAADDVPPALLEQLREPDPEAGERGGRLVIPLRNPATGGEKLALVERKLQGFDRTDLLAVRFVPLVSR